MKVLVAGGAGSSGTGSRQFSSRFLGECQSQRRFYNMSICDSELASVFKQERPEIVSHRAAQTVIAKSINEPLFDAQENCTFREQVLSY